jgi:hypothetical protein
MDFRPDQFCGLLRHDFSVVFGFRRISRSTDQSDINEIGLHSFFSWAAFWHFGSDFRFYIYRFVSLKGQVLLKGTTAAAFCELVSNRISLGSVSNGILAEFVWNGRSGAFLENIRENMAVRCGWDSGCLAIRDLVDRTAILQDLWPSRELFSRPEDLVGNRALIFVSRTRSNRRATIWWAVSGPIRLIPPV